MRRLPSPSLSCLFSNFLSLRLSPPPPITPLPLLPFLSYWIITFMAVLCCASLSYFPFPSLKCPHSTTAFLLPPQALITPPQPIHLSYCYKRCTKHQTASHQTLRASAELPVSYRSRPWDGDGAGVAPPPLRDLPVLFVRSFKHVLDITDLILAHCGHVHVTPETQEQSSELVMCVAVNSKR